MLSFVQGVFQCVFSAGAPDEKSSFFAQFCLRHFSENVSETNGLDEMSHCHSQVSSQACQLLLNSRTVPHKVKVFERCSAAMITCGAGLVNF